MKELIDMTEAHLTNVKTEIERLSLKKEEIVNEIQHLTNYLDEGLKVLDSYRVDTQETASPVKDTPSLF